MARRDPETSWRIRKFCKGLEFSQKSGSGNVAKGYSPQRGRGRRGCRWKDHGVRAQSVLTGGSTAGSRVEGQAVGRRAV